MFFIFVFILLLFLLLFVIFYYYCFIYLLFILLLFVYFIIILVALLGYKDLSQFAGTPVELFWEQTDLLRTINNCEGL